MGIRVMIVDDSPAMRFVIRRVLEMSGFELDQCVEAGHGGEALRLLLRQPVDLILTDINMPVVNGEQFMKSIGGHDILGAIPVVVVSTDATTHRVQQMMNLGAKGYVTKPFLPETLREELERVLGAHRA